MGQPAVAMTDHGNLFGAVQFYNTARAEGVHPVIGCEVYVAPDGYKNRTDKYNHLVLLCENQEGYRNLIQLVSTAYLEGFYYKPRIDKDLLAQHSKGLIALSACLKGDVNEAMMADHYEEGRRLAYGYQDMFGKGNFFLELQDHGLEQDKRVVPMVHRLAQESGIPLVVTNDSHYLRKDDARAHEILLCIQTGKTMSDPNRMRWDHPDFYLKSRAEMQQLFGDLGEALDRTCEIAQRCQVKLNKVKEPFPKFGVPAEHSTDSYFEYVARQGFENRRDAPGSNAGHRAAEARRGRIRRAPGPRNPYHPADEVLRLFPDCLGLHPIREVEGHPGGAGPRVGRRQPGELRDADHRYRSAPIRVAVRTLSEPRTHLDARHRYRLLHEPARRGDPVRHREVRPGPGGADHHLQHHGGTRGHQRRRPCARYELCRCGSHHQAGACGAEHQAEGRASRPSRGSRNWSTKTRASAKCWRWRSAWRVWPATRVCTLPVW